MDKSKQKKRIRKNKPAFHLDERELFGGRVKIFRTTALGKVWQMRVWFHQNQKYFRKSLRTQDVDEATLKAEEIYLDLRSKVRNGEIIFDKSARELVTIFLSQKEKEIGEKRLKE